MKALLKLTAMATVGLGTFAHATEPQCVIGVVSIESSTAGTPLSWVRNFDQTVARLPCGEAAEQVAEMNAGAKETDTAKASVYKVIGSEVH